MRLLFITSNRVGDSILSTGLLAHLIARHPGIGVTVVCGPAAAPLFAGVPGLERIIALRKRWASLHWLDMLSACLPLRWDIVVNLRRAPLARLLRAATRHTLPPSDDTVPRVVHIGRTLDLDPPPDPTFWPTPESERMAKTLLAGRHAVLAVAPTANWGGKIWPAARFAEIARRLTGSGGILPGAAVFITGGADEAGMAEPLIEAIPEARRIDGFGLDLPTTGAVLRRCALFIGNDSGLMHLAAAAGTPTLGLFGPSPEGLYAPWGANTAVARTPESFEILAADPRNNPAGRETLMGGLRIETVLEAAESLYRRTGGVTDQAATMVPSAARPSSR